MIDPTVVVPARLGSLGKARLAHVLAPAQRSALTLALLEHVLSVLRTCGLRTIVLAGGATHDLDGAEVWRETRPGLNAAVRDALRRIGGPVLVVQSDLPWLAPDDLSTVLNTDDEVVVALTDDGGTGALLMRERIALAFGDQSGLAHVARARADGRRTRVLRTPGLRMDLDDEAALIRALGYSPALLGRADLWPTASWAWRRPSSSRP